MNCPTAKSSSMEMIGLDSRRTMLTVKKLFLLWQLTIKRHYLENESNWFFLANKMERCAGSSERSAKGLKVMLCQEPRELDTNVSSDTS